VSGVRRTADTNTFLRTSFMQPVVGTQHTRAIGTVQFPRAKMSCQLWEPNGRTSMLGHGGIFAFNFMGSALL
jgi:hypothetical protein